MDRTLAAIDPRIAELIRAENRRQEEGLELIASENVVSPAVIQAMGSVLTNKYAEGYPGKRYYGGCEIVDQVEQLAIDRVKQLFGADTANVQPHSGSQANMAVYLSQLKPGDPILSLDLELGRAPHPRLAGELLGQALQGHPLRARPRDGAHRLRPGRQARARSTSPR